MLIGALLVGLCYKGLIPLPLAAIIVGRDVALIVGSFILRFREIPAGAPFFDTTYSATFKITPSVLGKVTIDYFIYIVCKLILSAILVGKYRCSVLINRANFV